MPRGMPTGAQSRSDAKQRSIASAGVVREAHWATVPPMPAMQWTADVRACWVVGSIRGASCERFASALALRACIGAGSGHWGALLRSCPPASACGRRLLLYFAAQGTPAARSGSSGGAPSSKRYPCSAAAGVGWPLQRSKGGDGSREAGVGGHERKRPPHARGTRRGKQAATGPGAAIETRCASLRASTPSSRSSCAPRGCGGPAPPPPVDSAGRCGS